MQERCGGDKVEALIGRKKMLFQCSKASNPTQKKFCLLSPISFLLYSICYSSNYTSIWMVLPPLGDLICIRIVPVYHFSIIAEFA